MAKFDYDAFISHATEDKADFVEPLAKELRKLGLKVWFDKFALKVGDSLHDSIEKGLARSLYGIVVFSPKFLSKKWTRAELNGLFAREMDGHKVILPIRHTLSSARMKKVLPMLADKFCLQSADGVTAVSRSLVECIRPELLELDVRKAKAFDAGESFIEEARKKNPGYDFSIHSNGVEGPNTTGTRFATTCGKNRIDIRVSDPSVIGNPPGGHVKFFGDGAKKAIEFMRTGKAQSWQPGEFVLENWNIPLMPSNFQEGILTVGERNLPNISPRHIRVEVGSPPSVVFPIMEMRSVRMGAEEAEAVLSDKEVPLRITMVFPLRMDLLPDNSKQVNFTLAWETTGQRASECKKLIEAIDEIRNGKQLRFTDIRLDRPILQSIASAGFKSDPFEEDFRRTVLLASQIEREFSVILRMPDELSEADHESLFHFDCLLNGREYGKAANTTLRFVKEGGEEEEAQKAFIKGEWTATLVDEPSDFPGYFPLFGVNVATPPWIRSTEYSVLGGSTDVAAFNEAPVGSEFVVEVASKGPTTLRWKNVENLFVSL